MKGVRAVIEKIKLGLSETQFVKLRRFFNTTVETSGRFGGIEISRQFSFSEKFLRHIFTGELEFLMESSGKVVGKLSGFHFDALRKDIARKALKLKDVLRCKATGAYKGVIQRRLLKPLEKSFFSESWTAEKVTKKLVEALKNLSDIEKKGDIFILTGITGEGMKIEIVAKLSGKLVTAYPII